MQQEEKSLLGSKIRQNEMSYICNINEIKQIYLQPCNVIKKILIFPIICCNCNRK